MRFRRASGAVSRVVGGAALALVLLAALPGGSGAVRAQSDIFTVRNVSVDETAGTAAEARQLALDAGHRRAFRRLIDRLVPEDQQGLVPKVESSQLPYYVRDFSVANERTSSVRYLADLTFRFNGDEIRALLRNNNVGFAEARGEPVVVLPVFRQGETDATLWGDNNPWRDVWAQRPSDDGLVPLVVPLGDLGDISAIDAERALAGNPEALRAIAGLYGAEDVLVSEATVSGDPAAGSANLQVVTRRYSDGTSSVTSRDRLIQVEGEPYEGFLQRAADRIDSAIQESWKRQNVLQFGNQRSIEVFVPLDGLEDWLNVRRRLHGVASIQQSDLASLQRDEAKLQITFLGDEQRLTRALEQRDLYLSLRADSSWELGLAEKRSSAMPTTRAPETTPPTGPAAPAPDAPAPDAPAPDAPAPDATVPDSTVPAPQ